MVTVSTMARLSSSRDISLRTDAGRRIRWGRARRCSWTGFGGGCTLVRPTWSWYAAHRRGYARAPMGCAGSFVTSRVARRVLWRARGRYSYPSSRHVARGGGSALAEQVREHSRSRKAPQVVKITWVMAGGRGGTRARFFRCDRADAFASGVTPAHLRTLRCAHSSRVDGGRALYLVNCAWGAANARQDGGAAGRSFLCRSIQDRRWAAALAAILVAVACNERCRERGLTSTGLCACSACPRITNLAAGALGGRCRTPDSSPTHWPPL